MAFRINDQNPQRISTVAFLRRLVFIGSLLLLSFAGFAFTIPASNGNGQKWAAADPHIYVVSAVSELRDALRQLAPGDKVFIKSGLYNRGLFLKDVHGTAELPIVITGDDSGSQPVFQGRGEGLKISSSSYIKLANMRFQNFTQNGMNIDDGGNWETPSHHIVLDNITILNIGPKGNRDALKMSGVDHFIVMNSTFKGWGGSGIDLVGCHNGVIENCRFEGVEGFRTANGIQIKGGSRSILVQNSYFENAGERVVHIGGATGERYFRPPNTTYEARDIEVAGNTFLGGEAQIAWITAQKSHVHHNLFYLPERWLGRILQETKNMRFEPSRDGFFEKNVVVTDHRLKTHFNIGSRTAPETFVFRDNVWFSTEGTISPALPTPETGGIYDLDPMIIKNGNGQLLPTTADLRIQEVGPWAYVPWTGSQMYGDILLERQPMPQPKTTTNNQSSSVVKGGFLLAVVLLLAYLAFKALKPSGKRS